MELWPTLMTLGLCAGKGKKTGKEEEKVHIFVTDLQVDLNKYRMHFNILMSDIMSFPNK